jgi:twitching motility protein PilT
MTELVLSADLDALIAELWQAQGSDLLLTAGAPPLMRVDGSLRPADGYAVLRTADTEHLAVGLFSDRQRALFEARSEVDFSFTWRCA